MDALTKIIKFGGRLVPFLGARRRLSAFDSAVAAFIFISLILLLPAQIAYSVGESAFDKVVDREKYTVGPGDRFRIDFWDGNTPTIEVTVSPEGFLLLTSIGQVDVANLNLEEAVKRIQAVVAKFYPESQFSITLVGTRSIKILISGGIKSPGLYEMLASQRVSEMIIKAGGFMDGSSTRNITFSGENTAYNVDLMRYERLGDLDANPYLYSGLKIYVPLITDSSTFVQVSGEVTDPGGFEYHAGDELGTMLKLAMGFTGKQGDSIAIFRNEQQTVVGVNDTLFAILPGDKIIVFKKPAGPTEGSFSITGEVMAPGRYPWEKGMNLDMALKRGGNVTDKGDIFSLIIFRKQEYRKESETAKALKAANVNNMNFGKDTEPLSLRVDKFYPDHLEKIIILPEDSIFIPYFTGSISVYGMVNQPGMIEAASPKMTLSDVITKAGGYSEGADKGAVDVYRKSCGLKITGGKNINIYDGDIVVVPNTPPDKKTFWDKLKDGAAMLGAAGVMYLVAKDLTD